MSVASDQIQWLVVRNHSSFLCKRTLDAGKDRKRTVFTKEPNNVASLNSYKFNGLINAKTMGLEGIDSERGGVRLVLKSKKYATRQRPSKSTSEVQLTRDFKRVAR